MELNFYNNANFITDIIYQNKQFGSEQAYNMLIANNSNDSRVLKIKQYAYNYE